MLLEGGEQFVPALFALTVAILDCEQLLSSILCGSDNDEDALAVVCVQADREVDAVRPEVDVLLARKVPFLEDSEFTQPFLLQFEDDGGREVGRPRTDERLQGFAHISRRDPFEVEPGNERVDRRRATEVGRQDGRGEVRVVGRVFARAVAHARLMDLKGARAGEDGTRWHLAIAHDAMAAGVIAEIVEPLDDIGHFRLEGTLEELPGALADDLVER